MSVSALILLAPLLAFFGYPNPLLHLPPLSLGLPLILVLLAVRADSPRQALRHGWFAGWLASLALIWWMIFPVGQYGGLPWWLAAPCPVLAAMVVGLYYALFAVAAHLGSRSLPPVLLVVACGAWWFAMEWLQSILLSGFPWTSLSAAWAEWAPAVQGAALIGAYGLSGVFAAVAVAAILARRHASARWLAVALIVAVVGYGAWRAAEYRDDGVAMTVAVVQGNIDQAQKWDAAYQQGTVERYITLSEPPVRDGASLLVWPETAMPFYVQDISALRTMLSEFAASSGAWLITGTPGYTLTGQGQDFSLFNRAVLLSPDGQLSQWYDKEHLVPFGEYVPFADWLPIDKLVEGVGDFSPGVRLDPLDVDGVALGMLVCYEGIFPDLAQQRVEAGAQLFINISNDAWFGDSSAPWQHLSLTAMRAIEQGRWIVRSTNTGISAFIDPLGRVRERTRQFTAAALTREVYALDGYTVYHRWGRVVRGAGLGLAGGFALSVLFGLRKRRGRTGA